MPISKIISQALMNQFERNSIPKEVDQRVKQGFIKFHNGQETKKMKKKMLVCAVATAILIPTGVYAGIQASHLLNEDVNLNGLVTQGVKKAVSEGISAPMDQKITDQGITIHFKEMYVENEKVLIHYTMTQQDGTVVPYEFDTTGLNVRSDGKEDGKQVEAPTYQDPKYEGFSQLNFLDTDDESGLPFYLVDAKGNEIHTGVAGGEHPEGIMAFVTDSMELPESIYLHLNINRIGKTKGSWKGNILINQSKAKQATNVAQ